MQLCYILIQKEWHFHFEERGIKTCWLCLRMVEIAFPRTWKPPLGPPFHQTPFAKNLDLPQSSYEVYFFFSEKCQKDLKDQFHPQFWSYFQQKEVKFSSGSQGVKKVSFIACHDLGKLQLTFTSPRVFLISPKKKKFCWAELITVLLLCDFPKNNYLPVGQIKNRIH